MDTRYKLTISELQELVNTHGIDIATMEQIQDLIFCMSAHDVQSVYSTVSTPKSREFESLIQSCYTANDLSKLPCFWSCRHGKIAASNNKIYNTDNDIAIIRVLFRYCSEIRNKMQKHDPLMAELSYAISRAFASSIKYTATTDRSIVVFMGTDKSTEPTGFHIGNNFWMAELPMLQRLYHQGYVSEILLYILGSNGNHVRTLNLHTDCIDLPVLRRNWHYMDGIDTKKSFVDGLFKQQEWDNWRLQPVRPYIMYSKLLRLCRKWKSRIR